MLYFALYLLFFFLGDCRVTPVLSVAEGKVEGLRTDGGVKSKGRRLTRPTKSVIPDPDRESRVFCFILLCEENDTGFPLEACGNDRRKLNE